MNPAFCDYIPLLKSEISPHLISSNCLQQIHAVAQHLPNALTPLLEFECRLDVADTNADFAVCVQARSEGQQVLGGDRFAVQPPETVLQSPVWQRIRNFSQNWVSEISPLHSQIHDVRLEFDASSLSDAILSPSCFFAPQPIYSNAQVNSEQHTTYAWITQHALNCLQGREISESVQHQLFRCIDLLPGDAYVSQIGAILSQEVDVIRLCLRNLTPDQMLDYLDHVRWSGSLTHLRSLLTSISGLVDRMSLDLDIGETVLPRLGLECYLDRQPLAEPRWPLFLDYLVATNLCLPEKRDGLLTFPGHIRRSHYPNQWSSHLTALSSILGAKYEVIFLKGLHHVKLVYEADATIAAKAYLAVVKTVLDKQGVKQFVPLALGIV